MLTAAKEVVTSVEIRRETADKRQRDGAFLKALWATYPSLVPAHIVAANENERIKREAKEREAQRRIAREHYANRRAVKDTALVTLQRNGPIGRSVIEAVCKAYEYTPLELVGKGRSRRLARARHTAMMLLRTVKTEAGAPRFSASQIGRMFGRDHSTVLHAFETFEAKAARDPEMAAIYSHLLAQV